MKANTDDTTLCLLMTFVNSLDLMWIQTVDTLMVFMKYIFEKVDFEKITDDKTRRPEGPEVLT